MFNIPGTSPIKITPAAAAQINFLSTKEKKYALRIGLKKGGCAGMEYTMEFVDEVAPSEEVIEVEGAKVVIAATAQMFLFGSEIDYEIGILESGFKFNNPNVTEACGCGESIKFKDFKDNV
jgi:iron-sulfur cluster assembly protein